MSPVATPPPPPINKRRRKKFITFSFWCFWCRRWLHLCVPVAERNEHLKQEPASAANCLLGASQQTFGSKVIPSLCLEFKLLYLPTCCTYPPWCFKWLEPVHTRTLQTEPVWKYLCVEYSSFATCCITFLMMPELVKTRSHQNPADWTGVNVLCMDGILLCNRLHYIYDNAWTG